ncbi:Na+/H+ antiporter NhaA [Rufibacter aurantiacus]|uniref:Na+/H+ antiporter NhaA n=1 Tax=Rufibacter aurantiacus TaxID=2817374 RepID=UPI001B30D89A|nr:Na+/H+ antiporter NhaA [Rufibacter aurantiacus]
MAKLINLKVFPDFFRSASAGGIILIISLVISLLIANSGWGEAYAGFLQTQLGFESAQVHLRYPILLWVNDGLMAIFFLLVGLEIKREMVEGELSSPRKAALPVFAAVGGMVVPAAIYALVNTGADTAGGWGIPMATDIAFAIGLLSLLGSRVPAGLKIFLTALAIVDDLGAIVVIAVFYSAGLHFAYLLYAAAIFLLLLAFNRFGVKSLVFYLVPGLFMWYFIHHSGVHATVAGVLTALTIPTTSDAQESPLEHLEHALTKPVNFLIMPIFALTNTNIRFEADMLEGLLSPLGLGIVLGLFLGKPLGIFFSSWVAVKLRASILPTGVNWKMVAGLGLLAGIGFTMSIFIALLSFSDPAYQTGAKFSILVASALSGVLGYFLLRAVSVKTPVLENHTEAV